MPQRRSTNSSRPAARLASSASPRPPASRANNVGIPAFAIVTSASGFGFALNLAGMAKQLTDAHARYVLAAAYAASPERFLRGTPRPPTPPTAAWINKPTTEEVAH